MTNIDLDSLNYYYFNVSIMLVMNFDGMENR